MEKEFLKIKGEKIYEKNIFVISIIIFIIIFLVGLTFIGPNNETQTDLLKNDIKSFHCFYLDEDITKNKNFGNLKMEVSSEGNFYKRVKCYQEKNIIILDNVKVEFVNYYCLDNILYEIEIYISKKCKSEILKHIIWEDRHINNMKCYNGYQDLNLITIKSLNVNDDKIFEMKKKYHY